jgi:hypothetical protein
MTASSLPQIMQTAIFESGICPDAVCQKAETPPFGGASHAHRTSDFYA